MGIQWVLEFRSGWVWLSKIHTCSGSSRIWIVISGLGVDSTKPNSWVSIAIPNYHLNLGVLPEFFMVMQDKNMTKHHTVDAGAL